MMDGTLGSTKASSLLIELFVQSIDDLQWLTTKHKSTEPFLNSRTDPFDPFVVGLQFTEQL